MVNRCFPIVLTAAILLSAVAVDPSGTPCYAQIGDVTTEDIIAGHLNSIGTVTARTSAKTRIASGPFKKTDVLGWSGGMMDGDVAITSSGNRFHFAIKTNFGEKSVTDQFVFDGVTVTAGEFKATRARGLLSEFIHQNKAPLEEGLFGGVLSTAWVLLADRNASGRLRSRGTKAIDGRKVYVLDFRPSRKATGLRIRLYFDVATFRHVRTEYKGKVLGLRYRTPVQEDLVTEMVTLIEDFSNFTEVDGLVLPRKYKLRSVQETRDRNFIVDWSLNISELVHNKPIDDSQFGKR